MPSMHQAKTSKMKSVADEFDRGFDVVCHVGRVTFGDGDEDPYTVALKLIGQHKAEGHYSFPHETRGTVHVTIEYGGE